MKSMFVQEPSAALKTYIASFNQHVRDRFNYGQACDEIQIGLGKEGVLGFTTIMIDEFTRDGEDFDKNLWQDVIEYMWQGLGAEFVALAIPCTDDTDFEVPCEHGKTFVAIKVCELLSCAKQAIPISFARSPFGVVAVPEKTVELHCDSIVDDLFVPLRRGVCRQG